jgi:hypothetical protein
MILRQLMIIFTILTIIFQTNLSRNKKTYKYMIGYIDNLTIKLFVNLALFVHASRIIICEISYFLIYSKKYI